MDTVYYLPPNRVRRNYSGGALLDMLAGQSVCVDADCPEDWIASTVEARNPGLPPVAGEGISPAVAPSGAVTPLNRLLERYPREILGIAPEHAMGAQLGFLAKLLDAAIRLHVQAHPTAEFARRHLNSRWGKLETYVILGVRPGREGYIRLGFQRPPSPAEWRRIVLEQDLAAMDACFDKIPVAPGDVWMVPGGLPHAIGGGLLVLEVMEPTDWVVRCEFERGGRIVPPEARFMGRDPDFAMQIFDFTALPEALARKRYQVIPGVAVDNGRCRSERLIGPDQTECFEVWRHRIDGTALFAADGWPRVGCPVKGCGTARVDGVTFPIRPGSHFLVAAAAREFEIKPASGERLEILECRPGTATVTAG